MREESRTTTLADEIIPSPAKQLVNKGMSSTPFAITVHQGDIYFLFLLLSKGSFYCYFLLLLFHCYILVVLQMDTWVI